MGATVTDLSKHRQQLVEGAEGGDLGAFDRLYKEYAGYAYSILRRQLGASPHVEDLLQLVFIKVYRELPEFRGDRPFRAWLRRACFFVIYDHLRQNQRHAAVALDEKTFDMLDRSEANAEKRSSASPEAAFFDKEIRQRTRRILDKLTPEKRMALVLHDFEGHTLEEAARVVGASKFTVRTRLTRARRDFARLAGKDKALKALVARSKR